MEEPINEDFGGGLSDIEDEDQSKSKKECKNVRCKPTIMKMLKSYQRAEELRRHIESTAKILESYQGERANFPNTRPGPSSVHSSGTMMAPPSGTFLRKQRAARLDIDLDEGS